MTVRTLYPVVTRPLTDTAADTAQESSWIEADPVGWDAPDIRLVGPAPRRRPSMTVVAATAMKPAIRATKAHDHEYYDGGDPGHHGYNGNHPHDHGGSQCRSPGGFGESGN